MKNYHVFRPKNVNFDLIKVEILALDIILPDITALYALARVFPLPNGRGSVSSGETISKAETLYQALN